MGTVARDQRADRAMRHDIDVSRCRREYAHASDDPDFEPDGDAMGLIPGSDTAACAVKVALSATRSMHIAMLLRHVQAFFNNGARSHPV